VALFVHGKDNTLPLQSVKIQSKSGKTLYFRLMEIMLLCVGKSSGAELNEMIADYKTRLSRYVKFSMPIVPAVKPTKSQSSELHTLKEAALLEKQIAKTDTVVLLDEKGPQQTSREFAETLQTHMNSGTRRLIFVVGGPYGFSETFRKKYPQKIAFSRMTFSHQMIRLFFCEQLYRAFTILNNHPYHNN